MPSTSGKRPGSTAFVLGFAAGLWCLAPRVAAHRIDELLQATLVSIEPSRIDLRLRLNPGSDLSGIFLRMVDRDDNGMLSDGEARAYAESVRRSLTLELDGRPLVLAVEAVEAADAEKLRTGNGGIFLELVAETGWLSEGNHSLAFANRHLPELSAFLVNAIVPKNPRIQVGRQERDELQTRAQIHFVVTPESPETAQPGSRSTALRAAGSCTAAAVLAWVGWSWRRRSKR